MRPTPARRLLAGIGVVGALVATGALPAAAAAPAAKLGVYMPDQTVAAGDAGVNDSPLLFASAPVELDKPAVTFDFTDLAGVAEVVSEDCASPAAHQLRCTRSGTFEAGPYPLSGLFDVDIRGVAGGPEGSGTLRTTFEAPGYAAVTTESTARVGAGVDLVAGPDATASAAPGAPFSRAISVTNAGNVTVAGFNALFDDRYALRAAKKFSNCR